MNNKALLITLSGLLIVGVIGWFQPSPTDKVIERITEKVGALTGPDITSPYLGVNGLRTWSTGKNMIASTTPCSIQNTSGGTTTLIWAGLSTRKATNSPLTWVIATSSTAFATSSALATLLIPANNIQTLAVTATSTTGKYQLAPNEWIVFGADGKVGGGHNPPDLPGTCGAVLIEN